MDSIIRRQGATKPTVHKLAAYEQTGKGLQSILFGREMIRQAAPFAIKRRVRMRRVTPMLKPI